MNVIELSNEELISIDGGNWFTDAVCVFAYLAGSTVGDLVEGFDSGFNAATKDR